MPGRSACRGRQDCRTSRTLISYAIKMPGEGRIVAVWQHLPPGLKVRSTPCDRLVPGDWQLTARAEVREKRSHGRVE